MAASKLYEKFPLDSERTQIRIIELAWSWTSLTPIVCRFSVHDINDCPRYKALSYTWGTEEADREILIDGIPIDIRDNLWQFLQKARRHVLCLRLWIDAICIDQSNVAERSHQVSLMRHIYSNATQVIAWLGPSVHDTEIACAYIAKSRQSLFKKALLLGLRWSFHYADLFARASRVRSWRLFSVLLGGISRVAKSCIDVLERDSHNLTLTWTRNEMLAVGLLFHNDYWSRVWIQQELLLAKDIVFWHGNHSLTWTQLEKLSFGLDQDFKDSQSRQSPILRALHTSQAMGTCTQRTAWQTLMLEPKGFPFAYILLSSKDLKSSDRRDRIFGLMGLVNEAEFGKLCIPINYALSCEELYLTTLRAFVRCKPWSRSAFEDLAVKLLDILNVSALDERIDQGTETLLAQCTRDQPLLGSISTLGKQVLDTWNYDLSPISVEALKEQSQLQSATVDSSWQSLRDELDQLRKVKGLIQEREGIMTSGLRDVDVSHSRVREMHTAHQQFASMIEDRIQEVLGQLNRNTGREPSDEIALHYQSFRDRKAEELMARAFRSASTQPGPSPQALI